MVNQVIAVLVNDGEVPAVAPAAGKPTTIAPAPSHPASLELPVAAEAQGTSSRHKASPLARRLASERGLSLDGIVGSGPKGRIVRIDVERRRTATIAPVAEQFTASAPVRAGIESAAPALPPGIGAHEAIPHSSMRRTIARRLSEAKATIPHFYLKADCNMDALLALRARINEGRNIESRISVNDFIIKAVARALQAVPEANVIWTSDALLRLADIDIAVAVATEGGLFTPVIRQSDRKSLGALSAEIKSLATRARDGRLKPDEYQGGSFSVSNLGMYGISAFSAIINPPQSAILAVGAAERRPIEQDGALVFASIMQCTLSVDHRAIDGALGARLLAAFKAGIENPMRLLV
jgi:pyruvate dehydrogenase E2 component (dihydrolipoamide acetyltransferase)